MFFLFIFSLLVFLDALPIIINYIARYALSSDWQIISKTQANKI